MTNDLAVAGSAAVSNGFHFWQEDDWQEDF
jgi:hypothetical protein